MIGQSQVTEPLMAALRADRVNHAYLFSGPRGCGKTTSARILARCLNCAQGPTDTPCGVCDSCVELSRSGGGPLDVVEIDAASHNGVDDARDLRERAIFAPARDRFKIFILDEAHMVTQQGFNALLKLVEEPPDHVKFIFATTEPEKVLGTIRSRTHHSPFRLVPPGPMLEYVQQLCETEGVTVQPGVLPLVVRAGGGSPRDTLSLLDQLIAGSEGAVAYERAVALLGYTHGELLDEVVDALGARDAAGAFGAVDRVVQTGQDPRRFVDDLLERLRDLIVVAATGQGAAAVLRGVPTDELERMGRQANVFGADALSKVADLVSAALDDMSGATSPRLQLELMVARVLTTTGEGAGFAGAAPVVAAPAVMPASSAPAAGIPVATAPAAMRTMTRDAAPAAAAAAVPAASMPAPAAVPAPTPAAAPVPTGPVTLTRMRDAWPEVLGKLQDISRTSWLIASNARVLAFDDDVLTMAFQSQGDMAKFKQLVRGGGPSEDLRTAIIGVLGVRVKYIARHEVGGRGDGPPALRDEDAPSDDPDPAGYDEPSAPYVPESSARQSFAPASANAVAVSVQAASAAAVSVAATTAVLAPPAAAPAPAVVDDWFVAPIPGSDGASAPLPVDDEPEDIPLGAPAPAIHADAPSDGVMLAPERREVDSDADDDEPDLDITGPAIVPKFSPPTARQAPRPTVSSRTPVSGVQRYGEPVVRQVLGATFLHDEPYEPRTRFGEG